jgi:hypothetical protein
MRKGRDPQIHDWQMTDDALEAMRELAIPKILTVNGRTGGEVERFRLGTRAQTQLLREAAERDRAELDAIEAHEALLEKTLTTTPPVDVTDMRRQNAELKREITKLNGQLKTQKELENVAVAVKGGALASHARGSRR